MRRRPAGEDERDEEVVAVPVRWRRIAQVGAMPVVLVLIGLLVGPALSATKPRTTAATARVFVSVDGARTLDQGADDATEAADSFARVARSRYVLVPVVDRLALRTTATALAARVDARPERDTAVIDVVVRDPSRAGAVRTANAVAAQLATAAPALQPQAAGSAPTHVTVIERASASSTRVQGDAGPAALVGAGVGLVLAAVWSLLMRARRKADAPTLGG